VVEENLSVHSDGLEKVVFEKKKTGVTDIGRDICGPIFNTGARDTLIDKDNFDAGTVYK